MLKLFVYIIIPEAILRSGFIALGCSKVYWDGDTRDFWKEPTYKEIAVKDPGYCPLVRGGILKRGEVPHHVSFNVLTNIYRDYIYTSFCGGNIISKTKVLTAAHCFLTNKKRMKIQLHRVLALAGEAAKVDKYRIRDVNKTGQWRKLLNITSPRYYRYPLNDLALLHVDTEWVFDDDVKPIPYTTKHKDYYGSCFTVGFPVRKKTCAPLSLQIETLTMLSRKKCEITYMKNMRPFLCSGTKLAVRSKGSGVICHGTGDGNEHATRGILVGVQSTENPWLPSLYTRVSHFGNWIKNSGIRKSVSNTYLWIMLFIFVNIT